MEQRLPRVDSSPLSSFPHIEEAYSLFGFHFIPTYEFIKSFRGRNFHIKNSFNTRNKHTARRFLYVLYKIHNNIINNNTKNAAISLTFFFLTFIWCRFWLLFYILYMAQNLRKEYSALSKKNEGKCTHSFSTSEYWTFRRRTIFFSMKAATNSRRYMLGFSSVFLLPVISNNWKNYKGGAFQLFNCWIWGAV